MTPFEAVNYFVDRATRLVEIPESMLARIRVPESELRVEVTTRRVQLRPKRGARYSQIAAALSARIFE